MKNAVTLHLLVIGMQKLRRWNLKKDMYRVNTQNSFVSQMKMDMIIRIRNTVPIPSMVSIPAILHISPILICHLYLLFTKVSKAPARYFLVSSGWMTLSTNPDLASAIALE